MNRHRTALLTWAIVYPMITVLLFILEPMIGELPVALRSLVLTVIMVPALVYVAMPYATNRLNRWLTRDTF